MALYAIQQFFTFTWIRHKVLQQFVRSPFRLRLLLESSCCITYEPKEL